jgi:zinc protease
MRSFSPRFCRILLISILLLVSSAGHAAESGVVRTTLKNGLRVVIVPDRLAPVVTVQINYLVGSNEAPKGFPGTAHAQEHMMFRGSPGLRANQLANIMAAMGGQFNADTQQTVTQYFSTVPVEMLDIILHVEALRMRGVLDSQPLWEKERGAIEQEVSQDLSNPTYVFFTKLIKHIYAGTPYAETALGTIPSFNQTTSSMLKKFHDTWYAPNNAILVLTGGLDPQAALKTVTRLFEEIPSRPLPARPRMKLQPLKPAKIEQETDQPYGRAVVAYRLPGYNDPDFAAGQVLADVLDSERGDLYGLVPAGKALAASFGSDPRSIAAVGMASAAFPKGGDGEALITQIKAIIANYVQKGFPADLVEAAKRREIAAAEFRKNSIPGLAGLWSQALAVEGRHSPDQNIEAISKVTVKDVNRVARRHLDNKTAITALLRPHFGGKPKAARTFGGPESFAPQQASTVSLPDWAQKITRAEVPPKAPAPADLQLANGLRLIILPSKISPTVSLYGQVKNQPALQSPPGKEGVDQVLANLFSYGTTTLDRLAFQKALDEIPAQVSMGTSFSLQVQAKHFDRGMQLLADNLLHPALPDSAFKIVRQETTAALAGELESPGYLAKRTLRKALLPKKDPALRQATPETVKKLSLDDVMGYYRKVFRPDMTTIVVIGKTTPEQARSLVEKYLGTWKATGPKPNTDLPPVPPNQPSDHVVPDPSRVQDVVILSETMGITRGNPAYYPLEVGRHVLSGAFYATRLSRDLREKTGLVYTVAARIQAGKNRSFLMVFYGCDPDKVFKARNIVEKNLQEMRTTPVTATELQQAKTLLLRQIPLNRVSVDDIADQWLDLVQLDLPLDEPHRAAVHFQKATAPQVQEAFKKYIRPKGFVQVTLGPAPK